MHFKHKYSKWAIFSFFFVLVAWLCHCLYDYLSFDYSVAENICQTFAIGDRNFVLCQRSGGATVGYYHVLYADEVGSDNIILITKGPIDKSNFRATANESVELFLPDKGDVVYLATNSTIEEIGSDGIRVKKFHY